MANSGGTEPSPWADPTAATWVAPQSTPTPSYSQPQRPAPQRPMHATSVHPVYAQRRPVPRAVVTGVLVTAVVAALLAVLIATIVADGSGGSSERQAEALEPSDDRSRLAELCPPPTNPPSRGAPLPPDPSDTRMQDTESAISYERLPEPFRLWDRGQWGVGSDGMLAFHTGYYTVTEEYNNGDYLATALSGRVRASVGDSPALNLECAGQQIAEDVRRTYYPQPTERADIRDEYTTLGGLPAWVSIFQLTFSADGLDARSEWVAVATIDVGKVHAAVLYLSLPDTHQHYAADFERVLSSVRIIE